MFVKYGNKVVNIDKARKFCADASNRRIPRVSFFFNDRNDEEFFIYDTLEQANLALKTIVDMVDRRTCVIDVSLELIREYQKSRYSAGSETFKSSISETKS